MADAVLDGRNLQSLDFSSSSISSSSSPVTSAVAVAVAVAVTPAKAGRLVRGGR